MYKHGRPVHQITRRPLVIIFILLVIGLAAAYIFVVKPNLKNTLNNSNQVRVTTVKNTSASDTKVSEPLFTATLPGQWKLASVDSDARYHSYQWTGSSKQTNGRWFKVFVDTIPKDQPVNYLLPVVPAGSGINAGQISDNCVNFTQGAAPEDDRPNTIVLSQASLPSRWQQVNFICDNANVNQQVVGASSSAAINTVTLSGATQGTHNFFFMYDDSNISPDFGQFTTILSSFKVK